jgi:hypothetical protein
MRKFFLFKTFLVFLLYSSSLSSFSSSSSVIGQRWTEAQALQWYEKQEWIVGFNFIPSSSDNVLEMFQKETYDPITINRELSFANTIGYNTARVFLHYLLWEKDSTAFLETLNSFLDIASQNKIKIMFALFDDCWNPSPQLGPQPEPIPGVHNSQWVQCPGQKQVTDTNLYPVFEEYVKGD